MSQILHILRKAKHPTAERTARLCNAPGQQLSARELARATRQGVDSHFSGQNQLQSKLLSPAVSHFSLPVQRQVDEKGEEEEAKRVAELKANYDAAVKAK